MCSVRELYMQKSGVSSIDMDVENIPPDLGDPRNGLLISQKELRRIFMETLEIVFTSQSEEQQNFGIGRVIDIFDQVIPNACVYGTAHWIDYKSVSVPDRLCMCKLFDLVCMHKLNEKGTWLTNNPIIDVPNFLPYFRMGIYPYDVHFVAVGGKDNIDLLFDFYVSTFDQDKNYYYCNVSIISRYIVILQKYEHEEDILYVFDPSPVSLPNYGRFLTHPLVSLYKLYGKKLQMDTDEMPTFTLQRAHSYATITPSEHYKIDVPQIISPSYNPLTQIDYDMINDICKSIMSQNGCLERTKEVTRNFIIKCTQQAQLCFGVYCGYWMKCSKFNLEPSALIIQNNRNKLDCAILSGVPIINHLKSHFL